MAFEQNLEESSAHFETDEGISQTWKLASAATTASDKTNGCFDCNICLDSAHDPVVTLCGHLYCWPCIYKWLHIRSSSLETNEQPKCPVCKANISHSSLVPLYGRGSSPSETRDLFIPRRPTALGTNTPLATTPLAARAHPSQPPSIHHQQYFSPQFVNYAAMGPPNFGGTAMTNFYSPTVGMFGDMVLSRMAGGSETSLFTYPNPLSGSGSPRMRRQEMQVEKSLNRVSIFLLCCLFLCLIFF